MVGINLPIDASRRRVKKTGAEGVGPTSGADGGESEDDEVPLPEEDIPDDDADDALCYFETHDWKGDYSWHEKEMRVFISQCKDALAKMVAAKHNDTCPSLDGDGKSCTCTKNPMDCGKRDFCHWRKDADTEIYFGLG